MSAFEGFGILPPEADQPLAESPQYFKTFFIGLIKETSEKVFFWSA